MKIEHVTIDFWGTLYVSNPNFDHARANAIYTYVDKLKAQENMEKPALFTLNNIHEAYEETKQMTEDMEKANSLSLKASQKHMLFFSKLGLDVSLVNADYFEALFEAWKMYPPILVNSSIPTILAEMSSQVELYLLSNSGMLPTSFIEHLLKEHSILMYCSADTGYTKHRGQLFELFQDRILKDYTKKSSWMHIGNDQELDIDWMLKNKKPSFKINNPGDWDNLALLFHVKQ